MDASVATYRKNSASAIWSRLIEPDHGDLTPIPLGPGFASLFQKRTSSVDELNKKAQQGTLTQDEGEELDDYIRVSDELAIIKAKARLSLKRAGFDA